MLRPLIALVALVTPIAALAQAPQAFETQHRGTFNGRNLSYSATVAATELTDAKGTPTARVYTTAYVAKDGDPAKRPVLFLFNGGPGAPSLWLHMGAFGPLRVPLPADPAAPIDPETQPVPNPETILDVADIVFIDPPGTGFSRILPAAAPDAYYSVEADAKAVAEVIARWLVEHGRTASPRYVLGESYGTIRAGEIAVALAERPEPVTLDGVILMGQALNIIETSQRPGNIVSHVTNLPTLTAIAWYHRMIDRKGRTLEAAVAEAEAFAYGPYLTALAQGDRLPETERARIAGRLAELTGIDADYFGEHGLFILKEDFRTELLAKRGKVMGRYDARYVAPRGAGRMAPDPSNVTTDLYAARLTPYLRDTLKVTLADDYRTRDTDNRGGWAYGRSTSPFSDWPYGARLAEVMAKAPKMRLLVGTGYYDLTTTIGAADYLVHQSGFPADRVVSRRYGAGHMAYTDPAVLRQFTGDVRAFVRAR